jgi:hypothetical protein
MRKMLMAIGILAAVGGVSVAIAAAAGAFSVSAGQFDPADTDLVAGHWIHGIGCPTNAKVANPNSSYTGVASTSPYTDPACTTGDPSDQGENSGLLLAKTGPTNNFAAAVADVNVPRSGIKLSELGYDLRKPGGNANDPRGSHCGAGAPRFDLVSMAGAVYFLGCNSPPAVVAASSQGWLRLRWGPPVKAYNASNGYSLDDITNVRMKQIEIVFDEGQDTGPDNFGLAVLDNIDINGILIGRGPDEGDVGNDNNASHDGGGCGHHDHSPKDNGGGGDNGKCK